MLYIERASETAELAARAARAVAVALDVEANGLFAYRPRLCTVQLAFHEQDRLVVAVVDTLRVDVAPLAPLLAAGGPIKVLHDLTFDAQLLAKAGAPLGGVVRDTSIAARLLGFTATGLAAMLNAELGIQVSKGLQQNDWGRRPLTDAELRYLSNDVAHLLSLDARLAERAAALGIADEIADECAYRLSTALRPPRDTRPTYARSREAAALDPAGRAVLRRLFAAREAAAEAADVPSFKVVSNEVLLLIARRKPRSLDALHAIRGVNVGRAAALAGAWLDAVEGGLRDGDVPEAEQALFAPTPRAVSRQELARRRGLESKIAAWRRAEAKRRDVDQQVVLPGHCAQDLIEIAIEHGDADEATLRAQIARIPGIGARRLERYADALTKIAGARSSRPARQAASDEQDGPIASS